MTSANGTSRAKLPDATRLGPVRLVATDLDRSIQFYSSVVGLQLAGRDENSARMGAGGEDIVVLQLEPRAQPAGRHAGLYHVALNYPTRLELARAARRIGDTSTPIQGASDHKTHEALYLADPDDNGLELAWDLPQETWPSTAEQYAGGPRPLDLNGLLALTTNEPVMPRAAQGMRVGHLHLTVGDIPQAVEFYAGLLGFDLQVNLGSAAFMSAGGYHHHLAVNVWRGRGAPPVPPNVVGLREWRVYLPDAGAVREVRERFIAAGVPVAAGNDAFTATDPWGIPFYVGTAS